MDELLAEGTVRCWMISNFRGWRLAKAIRIADEPGMPRPVIHKPGSVRKTWPD